MIKEGVRVDVDPAASDNVYDGLAELFLVSSGLAVLFVAIVVARKNIRREERLRLIEQGDRRKLLHVKQPGRS